MLVARSSISTSFVNAKAKRAIVKTYGQQSRQTARMIWRWSYFIQPLKEPDGQFKEQTT